jgi:hypothetical protein
LVNEKIDGAAGAHPDDTVVRDKVQSTFCYGEFEFILGEHGVPPEVF